MYYMYMYKFELSMHAVITEDVSRFGASESMEVFSRRVVFILLIQATLC